MSIIPEVQLKNILDYCLKFLNDDYNQVIDKKNSYLYTIFGDIKLNDYSYFENAVSILVKNSSSTRLIETHIFLNPNRFSLPTIHISLPNESPGPHGIGYDMQFTTPSNLSHNYDSVSERAFNSRFNFVFTSDNTFEVLIMYNAIKACLIGNIHLLEMNGIRNPILSGADILLNQELSPTTYARALQIDCFYESNAPSFQKYDKLNDLYINGHLSSDRETEIGHEINQSYESDYENEKLNKNNRI